MSSRGGHILHDIRTGRATLILRSILLGSVWSVSAIPPELVNKYGEDGRMRTRGYFNQFGQPINAMYGAGWTPTACWPLHGWFRGLELEFGM